jgi:hypothetical protein
MFSLLLQYCCQTDCVGEQRKVQGRGVVKIMKSVKFLIFADLRAKNGFYREDILDNRGLVRDG